MAVKYVILLAFLAVASAGVTKRETGNAFEEIQKHAEQFQKTFAEQLNSFVNNKNTQEATRTLKESSDSVLQQLSVLSNSLQSAIGDANGKAKEALETARANVETTAKELQRAHPDVEQNAAHLKDKLNAAVQNTLQESQKLAKDAAANAEAVNQKVAPQLKQAYDEFVKQLEAVQKKLKEAAKQ